jgi:DNA modification methylase
MGDGIVSNVGNGKPGTTQSGDRTSSNFHPTVKSLSLIKYLASLLKMPQNTLILDMFAGSGTLGVACEQLKIPYILIEKEEEYCDIIRARVAAANEPDRPAKRKKITKSTNTLIPWEEIDNGKNP